jgi:hypothetical protein
MPVLEAARGGPAAIRAAVAPRRDALLVGGVLVVALLLAAASAVQLRGYAPDDAYITYRIADNIAAGAGWTYNAGETTGNGATSPLYTVLLAVGALVYGNIPRLGTLVFVVGIAAAATCTFVLLRRTGDRLAGWIAVPFIALNPWLASTRGMESALFLACTAGTVLSATTGRMFLAGVLGGATTLVRGEGVLLCAVIGLHALVVRRSFPWRFVAGGVAVALPWVAYSLVALGSVVPDTLAAKVAQTRSGYWREGWLFLTDWRPLLESRPRVWQWGLVVLLLAVVAVVHWWLHGRPHAALWILTAFTGGFVFAYGVVLNVPNYHWYYALPVFWLSILAAVGAGHLWQVGRERRDALHMTAGVGGVLAVVLLGWAGFFQGANGSNYAAIGRWLDEHTEPDARIAATEIGYIGWHADRPIIDYLGLISPQSTEELREGDLESWMPRENPDYWVRWHPPMSFEEDISGRIWFSHAFTEVHRVGTHLGVFERVLPLDEATERAERELAEDAAAVARAVAGEHAPPDAAQALHPLLRLVAEERDLHTAFVNDEALQVEPMLAWALDAGADDDADPRRAPLAAHRDTYFRLYTFGGDARVPRDLLASFDTRMQRWWRTGTWPTDDG